MKECSRCGALKDREECFHRDRSRTDGRQTWCKDCRRQWTTDNPDKVLAANRRYREGPIYRAKRELINAQSLASYYRHHVEAKDSLRRRSSKRRALMSGSHEFENVDHAVVYDRDEGICGICFLPAPVDRWQLDHIIPVSRGGAHNYANTRVSHPECNAWKKDRLDEECGPVPGHIVVRVWQKYVAAPEVAA